MTVPGRQEAARLLLSLDPPPWFARHSRAVAEVAAWIGRRAAMHHPGLDLAATEAAGLLHDVDKLLDPVHPARRLAHGAGSGAWLAAQGHPELDPLVRDHPVTRLAEPDADAWLATAPVEAVIVAYADKRAGQRLESLAERFASWRRRYPTGTGAGWDPDMAAVAWGRALTLEAHVCALAGVEPAEVRRLPWTAPALADHGGLAADRVAWP